MMTPIVDAGLTQYLRSSLLLPFLIFFLMKFANLLLEVPTVRLLEKAICQRYYLDLGPLRRIILEDEVNESNCKIPMVQEVLSSVIGWKMSFDAIPGTCLFCVITLLEAILAQAEYYNVGLITALYYGAVADQHSRRLVLFLSCVGMLLAFSFIVVVCKSILLHRVVHSIAKF